MPVSFVGSANTSAHWASGSYTSDSLSFDATGCSLIVAILSVASTAGSGTTLAGLAMTYGGQSLLPVKGSPWGPDTRFNDCSLAAMVLFNPPTGVNTLSASWTNAFKFEMLGVIGFSGAMGISGIQSNIGGLDLTVPSSPLSLVVGAAITVNSSSAQSITGATIDWALTDVANLTATDAGHLAGASSVGLTFTPRATATPNVTIGFSVDQDLVEFDGAGNLRSTGTLALAASSVFAGAGNLSTHLEVFNFTNPATFAGTGNLSALPALKLAANLSFGGSSSLQVGTNSPNLSTALFSGVGSLSANILTYLYDNLEQFNGTSQIRTTATLLERVGATFVGNSTLSAAFNQFPAFSQFLNGTGSLSANMLTFIFDLLEKMGGAGNMNANVAILPVSRVRFGGVGQASITIIASVGGFANFSGASQMCVHSAVRLGPRGIKQNTVVVGPGPRTNVAIV